MQAKGRVVFVHLFQGVARSLRDLCHCPVAVDRLDQLCHILPPPRCIHEETPGFPRPLRILDVDLVSPIWKIGRDAGALLHILLRRAGVGHCCDMDLNALPFVVLLVYLLHVLLLLVLRLLQLLFLRLLLRHGPLQHLWDLYDADRLHPAACVLDRVFYLCNRLAPVGRNLHRPGHSLFLHVHGSRPLLALLACPIDCFLHGLGMEVSWLF
mmetsp:Transcript_119092/g.336870  ORF Transcript_119092/g.336870 Transcript_119092/m.336870 type:complete len:211 (-) Transcript_119092:1197-1829(-)